MTTNRPFLLSLRSYLDPQNGRPTSWLHTPATISVSAFPPQLLLGSVARAYFNHSPDLSSSAARRNSITHIYQCSNSNCATIIQIKIACISESPGYWQLRDWISLPRCSLFLRLVGLQRAIITMKPICRKKVAPSVFQSNGLVFFIVLGKELCLLYVTFWSLGAEGKIWRLLWLKGSVE